MKTTTQFLMMMSVLFLTLAGCSKDDDNNIDEPDDGRTAEQLTQEILGKWTFGDDLSFEARGIPTSNPLAKARTRSVLSKSRILAGTPDIIAGGTATGVIGAGFIEFLADGTFFILDADGNLFTGNYTATNGETIDLSGFGSITDITFADGRIDFVLRYVNAGQTRTFEIRANKAAEIPASERTSLICRTWELERIVAGWDGFENSGISKVTVTFSPSGTYVFQFFEGNGGLIAADVEYWKWHPTDANKFLSWAAADTEPTSNYDDYSVNILELTASQLEIASYYNGNVDTHLIFKAVQ